MARKNVFVSMGFPYTESHRGFLDALIELLRSCDVEPRVMNKTDYPTRNPLTDISQVMRECHGAIVVAFERKGGLLCDPIPEGAAELRVRA